LFGNSMKYLTGHSFRWIFILTTAFLLTAVLLRTVLNYSGYSEFPRIIVLLSIWLILVASEAAISQRLKWYIFPYLAVQTVLVGFLLSTQGFSDFFATLTIILSMQAFLRLRPLAGGILIGLWAVAIVVLLFNFYRYEALSLAILYSAANILFGAYTIASQRSEQALSRNEALAIQINEANECLRKYSNEMEQLSLARERSRLAREMHDSITQTVFSMSLAAQSAGLMVENNMGGVEAQLQRIGQLSGSALAEMKLLISELKPATIPGGLGPALRSLVSGRRLPGNLKVDLDIKGNAGLDAGEEQALFHIIREALNNTAKHARIGKARVKLDLTSTPRVEITDTGRGFDTGQVVSGQGMGLKSMAERAAEIGWRITIDSAPGMGTQVMLEKVPA
jgi:signal transduction histidine kinase